MTSALGFFTSIHSEPNSRLKSLGGELFSRIENSGNNSFFDYINEYESTNGSKDYRVIYIKNISNIRGVTVNSPFISLSHLYTEKREIFRREDLTKVRLNFFVPTYINKNEPHPNIYSNGEFYDGRNLDRIIFNDTNIRYYGNKVFLDFLNLKNNEYFPIIIERTILNPVPFIRNFRFKLYAKYSVTME